MIKMPWSPGRGYVPPPLYKVGYANNTSQRKSDLKAGNPFRLQYFQVWPVCKKAAAETKAKRKLSDEGLNYHNNYNVGGGTEWYQLPDVDEEDGRTPEERLAYMVRCEIDEEYDPRYESHCRNQDVHVSSSDLVDSLTYPNHAPNQASALMATNYDHLNPQSAGGYHAQRSTKSTYIEKWRQSLSKGNVLHVKYNCK